MKISRMHRLANQFDLGFGANFFDVPSQEEITKRNEKLESVLDVKPVADSMFNDFMLV
jgi:hypothetical protein